MCFSLQVQKQMKPSQISFETASIFLLFSVSGIFVLFFYTTKNLSHFETGSFLRYRPILLLADFNILIDIAAAEQCIEQDICKSGYDYPETHGIGGDIGDPCLQGRKNAAAADHHHEYARCGSSVFSEARCSQTEYGAPHYGGRESAEDEEHQAYGKLFEPERGVGTEHRQADYGLAAECGVYQGEFSSKMNRCFHDRTLYLFDTFQGFDKNVGALRLVETTYAVGLQNSHVRLEY